MTPREFKAWFDGFTEAMTGTPTKAQWARIKERVSEIDGKETTREVYVNRYWQPGWVYLSGSSSTYTATSLCANTMGTVSNVNLYNSTTAMYALGRSEATTV